MRPDLPTLVELKPSSDERGYFVETFHTGVMTELVGPDREFVQDNLSSSRRWVLRGLHYQLPPHQQGKLVRVSRGSVFDVAVDIRKSSPDFGRWWGHHLDELGFTQLWVPPGFAHGFLSLEEDTQVTYKVTAHHAPQSERRIRWDDPAIGIEWPLEGKLPILSDPDQNAPAISDAEVFD